MGRGQGDDRGEFLILISAIASPVGELTDPLTLRVEVSAIAAEPVPGTADTPSDDPFWDLPEEKAGMLDVNNPEVDAVSRGDVPPENYTATAGRNVGFRLGRIHSEAMPFTVS